MTTMARLAAAAGATQSIETVSQIPVQKQEVQLSFFSQEGFALAQRIANAFSHSDAVPVQFRRTVVKKFGTEQKEVENPSAIGNCIVAIEMAQATGMPLISVMQNADIIEGKLRWNDKFIVGCVNASRRFTPLMYDIQDKGDIVATYKEKKGWDDKARRYTFEEKTIKVRNLECIAWALPAGYQLPRGINTLKQAKHAGLPVLEGPVVSIKLAVEEGWYSKEGSKWRGEFKEKMLTMRAGRYFGDRHATDIVMGIGRSSDEERDYHVIDVTPYEREEGLGENETQSPQAISNNPPEKAEAQTAVEWTPSPEEMAAIKAAEMAGNNG